MPNKNHIDRVLRAVEQLRDVDPARVSPQELQLFQRLIAAIRERVSEAEYNRTTKIAVLHHHVSPVFAEEVTQFEILLNAGKFKRLVCDEQFDLILHGHKHWPEVFVDSAITRGGSLHVVSGATIGGWHARLGPGFFTIDLHPGQHLDATFVCVSDSNPRAELQKARKDSRTRVSLTGRTTTGVEASPRAQNSTSLQVLCQATARSMMQRLQHDEHYVDGKRFENIGWNHFLAASGGSPGNRVNPFATAFGLQVMQLTGFALADYRSVRAVICDTLLRMRRQNGCWSASSLGEPGQPVETAVALAALNGLIAPEDLAQSVERLTMLLAAPDCSYALDSTHATALLLEVLATVQPESHLVDQLSAILIHGVFRQGREYLCWSPRTFRVPNRTNAGNNVAPSVIHTANAISALRTAHRATDGRAGVAASQLTAAAQWLSDQRWPSGQDAPSEEIQECAGRVLRMNHYAQPVCMRALLQCDVDPEAPAILRAVDELLAIHEDGLWPWGSVRWPVWATLDSLKALTELASRQRFVIDRH